MIGIQDEALVHFDGEPVPFLHPIQTGGQCSIQARQSKEGLIASAHEIELIDIEQPPIGHLEVGDDWQSEESDLQERFG